MKHTLSALFLLSALTAHAQPYQLMPAFPNMPGFAAAVDLQYVPDGSNRLVLVQQLGLAYIFNNTPNVSTRKVFIDLRSRVSQTGGEMGFLGLAFHPNFSENGYIYVNFTGTAGGVLKSFVSRFQATGQAKDTVLRESEKILLEMQQPYDNHNGGWIGFGPDGYLYTSFGDGGAGGDPQNRAQNKDVLLGKILRLDVNTGDPYGIPPSNPFASGGGKPEIYAYGLRNAWRCSFDPVTKTLWAGDVGQGNWEEIDTIINGGNYGWRVKEGYACFNPSSGCDSTGFQSPLCAYPHRANQGPRFHGVSVTGGYVYRGSAVPSLYGKYVFADLNAKVFTLTYEGLETAIMDSITRIPGASISSFGVDQNNELYVLRYVNNGSQIYKFVPEDGAVGSIAEAHLGSIYPNPASNILQVKLADVVAAQVTIADVTGKIVLTRDCTSADTSIDIAHLVPGVYTATITVEGKSQTTKFVIQR